MAKKKSYDGPPLKRYTNRQEREHLQHAIEIAMMDTLMQAPRIRNTVNMLTTIPTLNNVAKIEEDE